MVKLYRTDHSGGREEFIAEFLTTQEALIYIQTHPQDFVNAIPKLTTN